MANINDVIPPLQLFQPTTLDEAADLTADLGDEAWIMAGGMDSFDWLKDRTKRTEALVDLSQVDELRGIREVDGQAGGRPDGDDQRDRGWSRPDDGVSLGRTGRGRRR